MLKHHAGMLAAALAVFLWISSAAQARPPAGGHSRPHGGGSAAPRVHVGGSSKPHVTTSNTRPGITVSGGGAAIRGQVINPAARLSDPNFRATDVVGGRLSDANFGRSNQLHTSNLIILGGGSPLGVYAGLGAAHLGHGPWFSYRYRCFWGRPTGYSGFLPNPENYNPDAGGPTAPLPANPTQAMKFAVQGDREFAGAKYSAAVSSWKQALAADPRNPRIVLRLSQGLFQTGNYQEAAGAAQLVLSVVPPEEWSAIVPSFVDLYQDNIFDYSKRLRDLEKARSDSTDDPSLRFLLGYHYAFLGFPDEAVRELTQVRKLAPQDEVARKLLEMVEAKRSKS